MNASEKFDHLGNIPTVQTEGAYSASIPQGQIDTVQSLALEVNGFNEGGIRWVIFRHRDKLEEAGAIFYMGKKLLIDRNRFITRVKEGL